MSAVVNTAEDVVNLALARIGYHSSVENMHEGSPASKVAINIYSQTRDEVMRSFDWGFAERIVAAAPTIYAAPFPWTSEYTYPIDCLKIRNIFGAAYVADVNDPRPILWTIGNTATAKVIWTKIPEATLVYTKQVTSPTLWEPLFIETFADALAKRLALGLTSMDAVKVVDNEEKTDAVLATGTIG
jgi:hypothetical protein